MRRRNPTLGMVELWHRLRQRGYTRCPESLFRVMRKTGVVSCRKAEKDIQTQALRADDPSRRARAGGCEGRAAQAASQIRSFGCSSTPPSTSSRACASSPPIRSSPPIPRRISFARLTAWYARRGIQVECVQTDNGFEFTNRFSNSKRELPTLFERTAAELGIRHKLIRPYTPRHNGKVERSHREDQKRFYSCHALLLSG